MTESTYTPQGVAARIQDIRRRINGVFAARKTERLCEAWRAIDGGLQTILEESKNRPQVTISLVGGTGAGKSTLLNALLDARILPVSNMKACTAAICNVTYAEQDAYEAEVQFIRREDWQREVELLLADMTDAKEPGDPSGHSNGDSALTISRAAADKIKAVYAPLTDDELAQFNLVVARGKEPLEITRAFNAGRETVRSNDLHDFSKRIAVYLASAHRYWPIVQSVQIRGPFAALRSGATLVDLPGINDPNEAREAVTKKYLKTCRFVWIVFNIKRVVTKDMMHLMGSDEFLRQVVMDGRSGAMTFVGTASDDIDCETALSEDFACHLPANAADVDILLARNAAVRDEVQLQLRELWARLVRAASEDKSRTERLAEAFSGSRIFTVSSREYLRLKGLSKSRPAGIDNVEQTEIVALRKHMEQICAGYGVEEQSRAHHKRIDLYWEELKRELLQQKAFFDRQNEATQKQMKEMEVQAQAARTFLDTKLEDTREAYAQALEAAQELLKERMKRAVDRGRAELGIISNSWSSKHWATLRAISRRNGYFVGSTGTHDLPADITKPILDSITFTWTDYFGGKLVHELDKHNLKLLQIADEHRRKLLDVTAAVKGPDPELYKVLGDIIDTTEKIVAELLNQTKNEMGEKIELRQRDLYDTIPDQVRANMRKAFELAGTEQGSGMKDRMVKTLTDYARQVAAVMFQDVEKALLDGVRGLNDWLGRKFGEMTATIRRQSDIALQNLRVDTGKLSMTEIQAQREAIYELEKVLDELMPSFAGAVDGAGDLSLAGQQSPLPSSRLIPAKDRTPKTFEAI